MIEVLKTLVLCTYKIHSQVRTQLYLREAKMKDFRWTVLGYYSPKIYSWVWTWDSIRIYFLSTPISIKLFFMNLEQNYYSWMNKLHEPMYLQTETALIYSAELYLHCPRPIHRHRPHQCITAQGQCIAPARPVASARLQKTL